MDSNRTTKRLPLKRLVFHGLLVAGLLTGVAAVADDSHPPSTAQIEFAKRTSDLLLATFLHHFRVAIDHHARRVTLEVRPGQVAAPSSAVVEQPGATPKPAKTTSGQPGGTTSPGPDSIFGEAIDVETWYAPVARQWVRQRVHFNYGVQERELTSYSIR